MARSRKCPQCITPAQALILRGLARGDDFQAIGAAVFLAPTTVAYHVARLERLTGAGNRVELVTRALVARILTVDVWPVDVTGYICFRPDQISR